MTTIHTIDSGATLSVDSVTGYALLTVDGATCVIASNWNCTEVHARMVADTLGPRGAAFIAAIRAGDTRGQRLAWRQIGMPDLSAYAA